MLRLHNPQPEQHHNRRHRQQSEGDVASIHRNHEHHNPRNHGDSDENRRLQAVYFPFLQSIKCADWDRK